MTPATCGWARSAARSARSLTVHTKQGVVQPRGVVEEAAARQVDARSQAVGREVREPAGGDHPLGRPVALHDEADRDPRVGGADLLQRRVEERRDQQPRARREVAQRERDDLRSAARLLELDVDRNPLGRPREDLLHGGRRRGQPPPQLRQRQLADRDAVDRGVVHGDEDAVRGAPDVELDHLRTGRDALAERRERVLGRPARPRPGARRPAAVRR